MTDPEALVEAAREELADLWNDLDLAVKVAYDGKWSMGCDNLVHRIKRLTPLVGHTPWEEIQISLLEKGIYQRVHAELGVEAPVDMDRVAEVRASIDRRSLR